MFFVVPRMVYCGGGLAAQINLVVLGDLMGRIGLVWSGSVYGETNLVWLVPLDSRLPPEDFKVSEIQNIKS